MKKSELKLMIRQIVREEVALTIKEVIKEITQPSNQVTTKSNKKQVIEKKNFSKNSVINEVLNETANADDWKTMGGGTYDSSRVNEVMSSQYGDLMNAPAGEVNADAMVASMGVDPNQVDDSVKNIFTKDYRSLMKAIDKKQGK
tara:strand:+ start:163 stop:594 length:432 start_codon:yes stop_codon:yes gene_type:complete